MDWDPSTEIPSLAEQERQREHSQRNAFVAHWLDRISLESPDGENEHFQPALETQPSPQESDSKEPLQDRPDMVSPERYNAKEGDNSDNKPQIEAQSPGRPRSPSDMFLPRSSRAIFVDQPPNHDAFPWVEPLRLPSLVNTVAQPATSNQAIYSFARRDNDLETVSRYATESQVGTFAILFPP